MAEAELLSDLFKVVCEHLDVLLVVCDPKRTEILYEVLLSRAARGRLLVEVYFPLEVAGDRVKCHEN